MHSFTKPASGHSRTFEHQCLAIFRRRYDADDAAFYGNSSGQRGIDIRLTYVRNGKRQRVVIQCKHVESLSWSTVGKDFKNALAWFAPRTDIDPDLHFIVATTADTVGTPKLDARAKAFCKNFYKTQRPAAAGRVEYTWYSWQDLVNIVERDPAVRAVFPPFPASDRPPSNQVLELIEWIRTALRTDDLRRVDAFIDSHLNSRQSQADGHDTATYAWVPTDALHDLVRLCMRAGDFGRAARVLDTALGIFPLDASLLLAELRSRRVLSACPNDQHQPPMLFRRDVMEVMADKVALLAPRILTAIGDVDAQLTIALWIVSYASEPELAARGLQRALALVRQAWPAEVPVPRRGEFHAVVRGRFKSAHGVLFTPPPFEETHAEARRLAAALATAYVYIRRLHAERFGQEASAAVEAADGWTDMPGLDHKHVAYFFSNLDEVHREIVRSTLPELYAEGRGRELDPSALQNASVGTPTLSHSQYACTAKLLLLDCAARVERARFESLRLARNGAGVSLVTTHHSLERLARVQFNHARTMADHVQDASTDKTMSAAIKFVMTKVVRLEIDMRHPPAAPLISRPAYVNLGDDFARSTTPTLQMCRDRKLPLISATGEEWQRAQDYGVQQLLIYWLPPSNPGQASSATPYGHMPVPGFR